MSDIDRLLLLKNTVWTWTWGDSQRQMQPCIWESSFPASKYLEASSACWLGSPEFPWLTICCTYAGIYGPSFVVRSFHVESQPFNNEHNERVKSRKKLGPAIQSLYWSRRRPVFSSEHWHQAAHGHLSFQLQGIQLPLPRATVSACTDPGIYMELKIR